ncbi:MAG TPA: transporter substrate-binding domain-containing protein [Pseudomonas sp.]|nr:transporter substrate-binding domain-containing protein [Pseudomonas sp.]
MILSRLLLVTLLSFGALSARAETQIAIDNANPPFMYQQDGQARGLYPLMLQAIFTRMDEPLEITPMPWKRALLRGANGELGVAGIYQNAKRLPLLDFSAPLFEEKLLVYVRKDQLFGFQQLADLHGKNIGVIRGWSYTDAFNQAVREGQIKVEESSADESNFRKLASGRLDAVIAIELAGQHIIKQPGLENIVALDKPLSINPTYLAFAKQMHQQALLQRFNRTLHDMQQDGSLQALVQQAMHAQ